MKLKDKFFETILKAYPNTIDRQTEEGKFLGVDGTYNVYGQYGGYYFAFLYTHNKPNNPYYHDPDTLKRAISGWDFYCSETNEKGRTRIVTYDQFWGDGPEEWGFYHWINTVELLKDYLPTEKLETWNTRIHQVATLLKNYIEKPEEIEDSYKENFSRNFKFHTANHLMWSVLAYYRYGMIYNDTHAMASAAEVMDEIIDHQLPNGSWLEGGSTIIKYNDVGLGAISCYEHYSQNPKAKEAVRKGLDYVLNTMYPDFTRIETLDGRNRYGKELCGFTSPTYSQYKDGIAYLSKWISFNDEAKSFLVGNSHGVVLAAHIADLLSEDLILVEEDMEKYIPKLTYFPEIKAKIVREGPWVIPFACLEQKVFNNRFALYKQNLISVFNKKSGLVIGGGHSVAQPQFSCFNVINKEKLTYIHESGDILEDANGMSLSYGGKRCKIEITRLTEEEVTIEYSVDDLSEVDRAFVNIPLVGDYGDAITIDGENVVRGNEYVARLIEGGAPFAYRSLEMTLSEDAVYNYPIFPYNSYMKKQQKNFQGAFAIITVELNYKNPKCKLTLR